MAQREKVLVTGGFGAIGSFVLRRLVAEGHEVVVYSRSRNYALVPELEGTVEWAEGDVFDRARFAAAVASHGVRRIIHLAAALPSTTEEDMVRGYEVNVIGALHIFDVARDLKLERVVFTSSKSYYGILVGEHAAPHFKPVTEDYVGQTANVYGATKKAMEDAAYHHRRLWGTDLIALRLGSTYGPGKRVGTHGGYPGLKSRIVESSVRGESLTVPMPEVRDDIVYNGDVAKGAVLACFAPPSEHWQFNISSEKLVSLREFAEATMRAVPNHKLTIGESREDDAAGVSNVTGLLSIARARAELGYEPDFGGVAGVEAYVRDLNRMKKASTLG